METYFVGTKARPEYLIEIFRAQKTVRVYQPDRHSKGLNAYEKYVLGDMVSETKYKVIHFSKPPVPYKKLKDAPPIMYAPHVMFVVKKEGIVFGKDMKKIKLI
jgi:hypothetical protein